MNWQYPNYGTETQCKEVPITFPPSINIDSRGWNT